jgi:tol-pal system protein YbgF
MWRVAKSLGAVLCLAGGACATTRPAKLTPAAEAEQTINTLRAQNSGYIRQIEELQNRVFILEDRLDSHRVVGQQRAAPVLPISRTLGAPPAVEADPLAGDEIPAPGEAPARADSRTATARLDLTVEYSEEAARAGRDRPVLRLERGSRPAPVAARSSRAKPARATPPAAPARDSAPPPARRIPAHEPVPVAAPTIPVPPLLAPPVSPPPAFASAPAPARAAAMAPAPAMATAPGTAPSSGAVPPPAGVTARRGAVPSAVSPRPLLVAAPAEGEPAVTAVRAPIEAPAEPVVDLATTEEAGPPERIPVEPLRLYRSALAALRAGKHAPALAAFRRFLVRYPTHDYADNALYWIGECYYDLKEHRSAAREFRGVIERYPRGNKVPDAMLKLGFSYLAAGETATGRQVLESLRRAFPHHASSALATTRLAEVPRAGKGDVSLGAIVPGAAVAPGATRPGGR